MKKIIVLFSIILAFANSYNQKILKQIQSLKSENSFSFVVMGDNRDGDNVLKKQTNAKKLNNLLDKYNVTMFFGSHIHSYFRGFWHKTPYIITGGAGAPLKKNGFYHYIKVIVNGDNIEYKVIKIDDKKLSFFEKYEKRVKDIF